MTQSKPMVLVCVNGLDGVSEGLSGSGKVLVQDCTRGERERHGTQRSAWGWWGLGRAPHGADLVARLEAVPVVPGQLAFSLFH